MMRSGQSSHGHNILRTASKLSMLNHKHACIYSEEFQNVLLVKKQTNTKTDSSLSSTCSGMCVYSEESLELAHNSILDGPITNLLSILCIFIKIKSMLMRRGQKSF